MLSRLTHVERVFRGTFVLYVALVGGCLFWSASALAAAPEAPVEVEVQSLTSTTAVLRGVLNPGNPGEAGTYEFLYKAGTACEGGSKGLRGLSFGSQGEEVNETLSGLQPDTEYTVCLLARNLKGEETVGPVPGTHFTTAASPETPETTSPAEEITDTTAKLSGVLNPQHGGEASGSTYEFLYKASTGNDCTGGSTTPVISSHGQQAEVVSAPVSGLSPGTEYAFCLLARDEAGKTAVAAAVSFTTLAVGPSITGESFSEVGSSSVKLDAEIQAEGLPSTYFYEYGPTGSYGSKTATVSLGDASGALGAPAQLTGLEPDTEYHFRVIASNTDGIREGTDTTFHTLPASTPGLPDGRTYEMVTPPQNQNADIYTPEAFGDTLSLEEGVPTKVPFQVASNGQAVAYVGDPTSNENNGNGEAGHALGNSYVASRSSNGGWTQTNVQPLGYQGVFYQAFSPELTVGIVQSEDAPVLSSEAPGEGYAVLYAHDTDGGEYRPLFSTKPPNRRGGEAGSNCPECFTAYHVANSTNPQLAFAGGGEGGGLFFEANDALLEGGGPLADGLRADVKREVEAGEDGNSLYMSVGGRVSLVSVLPDGEPETEAVFGAKPLSKPAKNPPDFSHVISSSGSRVFWSGLRSGNENLYMSEDVGSVSERTVQVDASVGGGGRFWTASSDGSRVFFTKGGLLYEYDVNSGSTVELAPGVEVLGVVGTGTSGNGEYVYYIDSSNSLYVLHEGTSTQIATLSSRDIDEIKPYSISTVDAGNVGDLVAGMGDRTAVVSPGGRSVVFMSNERLTGYDNEVGGVRLEEVYLYEVGGGLTCVSCSESGEAPQYNLEAEEEVGAFIPVSWSNTYMPGVVSEHAVAGGGVGSEVFFDSGQPLVPGDRNGRQDVYEWESDGVGSCTRKAGCVYLLSGGSSQNGVVADWG